MNLIRYQSPVASLSPCSSVADEVNRLLAFPFIAGRPQRANGWTPALDVHEDEANYFVRLELPGLKKDQIQVSFHDDTLTVSGERASDADLSEKTALRRERFQGKFERSVSLPVPVNAANVAAAFEDGVLTVTLPKSEEAKPRQIAVA